MVIDRGSLNFVLLFEMKSTLLTSTHFGKFYPRQQTNTRTVELSQIKPIQSCKFDLTGEKLYVLDGNGALVSLTLNDSSISTFQSQKISSFQIDSANPFSIWAVTRQSDLLKISFENKNQNRLMNLNLNRILSFQKNHFTNLLIALDYKVLMVIDSTNSAKIRSIKAKNNEIFTQVRFANQNRFLVLAVKNNEIRVIEIMNLKTIDTIILPIEVKGLKIQISFDSSLIAVYGETNMLFLITMDKDGKLSYQMTELPIKYILQLKFTYENDLVILANDRIVYGISPNYKHQFVPFFNSADQKRISAFDINLSANCIAFAANKTIHFLDCKNGVRRMIETADGGKEIEYSEHHGGEKILTVGHEQYQYDDEDCDKYLKRQSKTKNAEVSFQSNPPPNLPDFKVSSQTTFFEEVNSLNTSPLKKSYIQQIYLYLHQIDSIRDLAHLHKSQTIGFVQRTFSILNDPKKCAQAAYHVLTQLGTALNDGSLERYSLILAPRVMERIHKMLGQDYSSFITRNMLNLFEDYLAFKDGLQVLSILLKNIHRESYLIIFLICLLLQLRANSQSWPNAHCQELRFNDLLSQTENLLTNPKHAYIFAKVAENVPDSHHNEQPTEDLETMLSRQERIKQALKDLRKGLT